MRGICVSHIASIFGHDTFSGNAELLSAASIDERLWPFVILNPSEPSWEKELQWAQQSGATGVRLVPGYHDYTLLESTAVRLISEVGEMNLPLQLCVRLVDDRLQHKRFMANSVPLHEIAKVIDVMKGYPVLISGLNIGEWNLLLRYLANDCSIDHVLCNLWHCNGPLGMVASLCGRTDASSFASVPACLSKRWKQQRCKLPWLRSVKINDTRSAAETLLGFSILPASVSACQNPRRPASSRISDNRQTFFDPAD